MGPNIAGAQWRANAVMQISQHTTCCWSGPGDCIPLTHVSLFSRCTPKTSAWTGMLLLETIKILKERYGLEGISNVMVISDSGPHYCCNKMTSLLATRMLDYVRMENGSRNLVDPRDFGMATVTQCFRAGQHGKSRVDRAFATDRHRIQRATKQNEVLKTSHLVRELRAAAAACAALPYQPVEIYVDYVPKESQAYTQTISTLTNFRAFAPAPLTHGDVLLGVFIRASLPRSP